MICWITEQLGTAAWDQVKQVSDLRLVDVRGLVDRAGNQPLTIKSKIGEVLTALRQGQKVVIGCDYGMSRSNAVAAGALAEYEGISLNEAIQRVLTITGESGIKIEVLSAVHRALEEKRQNIIPIETTKRRVMITGSTGFIGSVLRSKLGTRYEVATPVRQEVDLVRDVVPLDLLVKEKKIDTIIHLANPRIYSANEAMGAMVTMVKNVLDVCKENGILLVYLSSWEIYSGYEADGLRANESLAPNPGGTYGQAKFLCETLIEHYYRHYHIARLVLRVSPVYGVGSKQPRFIWNFIEKALSNQEIVTHKYINGFPKLDLIHIDDVCRALVPAIENHTTGILNLGMGVGRSTTDVARYIVDVLDSQSSIQHVEVDRYTSNITMDISLATEMLGWNPTIELERGIGSMLQSVP